MATGEEPVQIQETGRQGAVREYSVRIAASYVDQRVAKQLASLGQSVRLPGFRPGKIPGDVLKQRYGARARGDVVKRLAGEFAQRAVPEGGMLSAVDLVSGAEAGELVLKFTATSLPDLPVADFSGLTLERLVLETSPPQAEAAAHSHLKRQVLDHLEKIYEFPIASFLVEREFGSIVKAAQAQLELDSENRSELEAEFRRIAERRIRLGVVVAETARRQGVRVSDEEVNTIRQAMTEQERATETPAQTRSRWLEEKVIAWIVSRAQLTERRVTIDELAAL
ncbi:MAG: hypothetical protein LAP38_17400 [Acidobacteriia bacterium]|nr:hypothetical protein [Terriglobia bacterium]